MLSLEARIYGRPASHVDSYAEMREARSQGWASKAANYRHSGVDAQPHDRTHAVAGSLLAFEEWYRWKGGRKGPPYSIHSLWPVDGVFEKIGSAKGHRMASPKSGKKVTAEAALVPDTMPCQRIDIHIDDFLCDTTSAWGIAHGLAMAFTSRILKIEPC